MELCQRMMCTNDEVWIRNHQTCAAMEISDTPGIVYRLIYAESQCGIARCLLRAWNAVPYLI
jgi:hypothetical protein